MKRLLLIGILLFISVFAMAEINLGSGAGFEMNGIPGISLPDPTWASPPNGNIPIADVLPEIFLGVVFRADMSENAAFGLDVLASGTISAKPEYPKNNVSANNPMFFLSTDLTFHFPMTGLTDVYVFGGIIEWNNMGIGAANIRAGFAGEVGPCVILHYVNTFFLARASYRFMFYEPYKQPSVSPIGTYNITVLAGFSW